MKTTGQNSKHQPPTSREISNTNKLTQARARFGGTRGCDAPPQKVAAMPSSRESFGASFGLATVPGDEASPPPTATGASQLRMTRHRLPTASFRLASLRLGASLALGVCCLVLASRAFGQGTAFTYQGRLNDGANPATGIYDFRFAIYDAASAGTLVAGPLTNSATGVTNGLFTVTLDPGVGVFTGSARWLEIGVRTNGSVNAYQALSPRQPLTAAPYAVTAGNVTGLIPGSSLSGTYSNAVTLNNAANSFTGNGAGLTSLSASQLTSGTVPAAALGNAWQTGGNSGTSPGTNFLGTTDNQPLELKVNSQRVVRWERNTNAPIFGFIVPNIVSGHESNTVANGVGGATIAGGGGFAWYGSTSPQTVNASFGTIGGGVGNVVLGVVSTVAGGERGFIGTNAYNAFLGGGARNSIEGPDATIGGGTYNSIQPDAYNTFLGGGYNNSIQTSAGYSVLGGGYNNSIQPYASSSFLGGGYYNSIQTNAGYSVLGGGYFNVIRSSSAEATIAGGAFNTAIGSGVTIGGGYGNTAIASSNYYYATVAGGNGNTANGYDATVGGGGGNSAHLDDATVAGGGSNTSSNFAATVGGGFANASTGDSATTGGGGFNISSGNHATVGGGEENTSSGDFAFVGGGFVNYGSANYTTVPGGYANSATADYSFAAGTVAAANHSGTFIWSDASDFLGFSSIAPNEFAVRARGGVRFVTGGAGMTLDGQTVVTTNAALRSGGNAFTGQQTITGGNVGIGTASPQAALHVRGADAAQFTLQNSADNSTWYFSDDVNDNLVFQPNTGFGAYIDRAGNYHNNSDARLKQDITPLGGVLDRVLQLRPVSYHFRSAPEKASLTLGFIAQEVEPLFPEMVGERAGLKSIAYSELIPVTIRAVQELNQKVEAGGQTTEIRSQKSEERIQKLEEENAELKQRLEVLEQVVHNQKAN